MSEWALHRAKNLLNCWTKDGFESVPIVKIAKVWRACHCHFSIQCLLMEYLISTRNLKKLSVNVSENTSVHHTVFKHSRHCKQAQLSFCNCHEYLKGFCKTLCGKYKPLTSSNNLM